jgi:hypothetical protein
MDVGAFVQENKRWLVGVAVGGLVYLVAGGVGSVYDAEGPRSSARAMIRSAGTTPLHDRAALAAAQAEAEQLATERRRLEDELAFVPSAKYQLGQGAPDEYLFQVGRGLKQAVLAAAGERDVQVADKDLSWEAPTGVDEIRGVLFGLELLDETSKRLFAAHDAARAANPDALGLRALQALKVEARRGQRAAARTVRPGDVDLRDLLVQERISFQFQADEATCAAFLEACRQPRRALVIETWQMQQPPREGEACTVKGTLQGIAFKEK